ncbi:hypothetical protein AWE51_04205 [Aquimarina aggregata]|uniref:Lanthionine synthetase n=1 Tax=Aquimarina aggregata TaxID=1642818 RepID=A0A162DMJ2_9FLAO|nr:lanthionine synthetase C family protein [Aquimarina aggregata]KZS42658.1 hypothetical protein AWE51_04205 [Aquimarina aggregata]
MNIEIEFKKKLKQISEIIDAKAHENKEIGVLSGISGVALFQFYYSKYIEDDSHADKGAETITRAIDLINEGVIYPTFCTGIAGACWVLEVLKEEEFVELDEDFLSSDLDAYLLQAMKADIETENYDFLHGAMGYGYYFLKRYQNVTNSESKKAYKEYLDLLINALKNSSLNKDDNVWWETELIKDEGTMGCNLSLSHGMSSNINFLSRIAEHSEFYDDVKELLKNASHYILSCKNKDTTLTATFPNWVVKENADESGSRLAWCYGDLGIGLSLLRVGKQLNDTKLYNGALSALKYSTKRRDIDEAGVMDAGLCHGAYGIMHIYHYLYKTTNEVVFKETADFWAEKSLELAIHTEGYAGYMMWRGGQKDNNWKPSVDLLEGIAGIGLSMISYLAPFDTKWDECLLIG